MVGEKTRGVVVIVEDDAPSRIALGRLLRAAGFDAVLYESAEALIAAPPAPPPLCLVVDVHLLGMSGIDLQARLREAGSSVPVIVTTAHREAGLQERAKANGCTAFFWKPFCGDALLAVLASVVPASTT
jgi:FixJ family two-component response regulator